MRTKEIIIKRKRIVQNILREPWCYKDENYKNAFESELRALRFVLGEIDQPLDN